MRGLLVAALSIFALALLACNGGGGAKNTPASTASTAARTAHATTPTPIATSQTPASGARHTGIPEVDAIIDAVFTGDPAQLRPFYGYQSMACTATPQGIGAFYCDEGEADGTVSQVLPVVGCEGSFHRADGPVGLGNPQPRVYAVYRTGGSYTLVFPREQAQSTERGVLALGVKDGRVTFIYYGCGDTPERYVTRELGEPVLPPE